MPQKVWAVGEEVLAADFNTYVQNQTCPAFTGTAQRDSQWAAPPDGAVCVTGDTDTFWQYLGGAWYTPFRRISGVSRTTSPATAAAETVVVTAPAATVPANRQIRVQAGWYNCTGGAGEGVI